MTEEYHRSMVFSIHRFIMRLPWIEIYNQLLIKKHLIHVAPFTGAWIEINVAIVRISCMFESHPSRVRGLKWFPIFRVFGPFDVAPFTGAWIEIDSSLSRRRCC